MVGLQTERKAQSTVSAHSSSMEEMEMELPNSILVLLGAHIPLFYAQSQSIN